MAFKNLFQLSIGETGESIDIKLQIVKLYYIKTHS